MREYLFKKHCLITSVDCQRLFRASAQLPCNWKRHLNLSLVCISFFKASVFCSLLFTCRQTGLMEETSHFTKNMSVVVFHLKPQSWNVKNSLGLWHQKPKCCKSAMPNDVDVIRLFRNLVNISWTSGIHIMHIMYIYIYAYIYNESAALCHLVLGQKFASPVSVGNVVDGQSQIVVAIFEEQRLGIFQQNSTQTPLQIQHLLHRKP